MAICFADPIAAETRKARRFSSGLELLSATKATTRWQPHQKAIYPRRKSGSGAAARADLRPDSRSGAVHNTSKQAPGTGAGGWIGPRRGRSVADKSRRPTLQRFRVLCVSYGKPVLE